MIGLYLALSGALLYVRSYVVFGVDYLAALYVYFPAEGRIVVFSLHAQLQHAQRWIKIIRVRREIQQVKFLQRTISIDRASQTAQRKQAGVNEKKLR